jgi:hypothetical protein
MHNKQTSSIKENALKYSLAHFMYVSVCNTIETSALHAQRQNLFFVFQQPFFSFQFLPFILFLCLQNLIAAMFLCNSALHSMLLKHFTTSPILLSFL